MELVLVHRFLSLLKLGDIKILNLLKHVEENSCMSLCARDNVVRFHTYFIWDISCICNNPSDEAVGIPHMTLIMPTFVLVTSKH